MGRSFKMELKIIYISLINQSSLILILVPFFLVIMQIKKLKWDHIMKLNYEALFKVSKWKFFIVFGGTQIEI